MEELETMQPLSEEELVAIIRQLEDSGDYTSDLAKVVFTLLVASNDLVEMSAALQLYYQVSGAAIMKTARVCVDIVGLKDKKKITRMIEAAAHQASMVPGLVAEALTAAYTTPDEGEEDSE